MESILSKNLPEYKGVHFGSRFEITRYVITDALGNIAGRDKGYKSMSAALSVANRRDTKVYKQLQNALLSLCTKSSFRTIYRVEAVTFNINEL